ncbi:MAG: non-homologous end-joining DNA ligase [Sphingomicrobium sp.]
MPRPGKDPGPQPQRSILNRATPGSRRVKYPGFIEPSLATLVDRPPRTRGWVHEIKFDGYRTQLHLHDAKPKAFTRRGNDWSKRFGNLLSELVMLPTRECIIDGEAVVQDENGLTDFGALQDDLAKGGSDRIVYFAFDLLYLDGYDLRGTPLLERKRLLAELIGDRHRRLHLSRHEEGSASAMFKRACQMGIEGIVSKRADAVYTSGRSNVWSKITCRKRETFVVAGLAYSKRKFEGIYLARRDDMSYAGKVEHGFTLQTQRDLERRAHGLATRTTPLSTKVSKPKAHWLKPGILVEVEYRALTGEGKLRHPSFKGVREDL